MRRAIAIVAAVLAVALSAGAQAITYGQPDGNRHPQVGALVGTFDDGTYPYCSGVLISPTVFLTAAHCEEGATVCVTFDEVYAASSPLYCGQWYAHPDHHRGEGAQNDVAVVVFATPITGITPASLPTSGLLDAMKASGTLRSATFTSVGYGAIEPARGPGGLVFTYPDRRMFSVGSFLALTPSYLRLSQNPVRGDAGSCFADSGGAVFFGNTTTLAGIVSTGDAVCRATNVVQRLDTASVRDFLADYVYLP